MWPPAVLRDHWTPIPNQLLREYHRLEPKLTTTEVLLLLLLASFRSSADDLPFPSKPAMARMLRMSTDGVRNCIRSLVRKGYLRRVTESRTVVFYDITPFVAALGQLPFKSLPKADRRNRYIRGRLRTQLSAAPAFQVGQPTPAPLAAPIQEPPESLG
jgi:hypothetical protein